ncbi:hypothetical protein Hypma_009992 [Hypsizygus marmoreus]|uniref:Uncharacterized protein n=1 Tax=Hypsizygus marmoreus TaxID=39966 RepID=A0A369JL00_HYPMA|nr:hypothetical protein Hypma_009992 [Hypsizygus marmoreus]
MTSPMSIIHVPLSYSPVRRIDPTASPCCFCNVSPHKAQGVTPGAICRSCAIRKAERWLAEEDGAYHKSALEMGIQLSFAPAYAYSFLKCLLTLLLLDMGEHSCGLPVAANIPRWIPWTYSLQKAYFEYPGASAAYWEPVTRWARRVLLQPHSIPPNLSRTLAVASENTEDVALRHAEISVAIHDTVNTHGPPQFYLTVGGDSLIPDHM